jgi:hypothetical protein
MNETQILMLIAAIGGFCLARYQYKKSWHAGVRTQAICGTYYAKELAGRALEDWEVKLISGNRFSTYGEYLNAKDESFFHGAPWRK